jgi:DNA-binding transcriptional MerR regulator
MKIQEVCNRTGLSKRNIHFYIKERLLAPGVNEENGYYNFDEEDCLRLSLVRELRNAGVSISMIRSIINTPAVAGYYLRLHLDQLKKEIGQKERVARSVEQILERLPLNPGLENVYAISKGAGIPEPLSTEKMAEYGEGDNNLVNQFLWTRFLPEENFTEYQQYLWSKINRITGDPENANYRKLKMFLSRLSQERVDELLTFKRRHENEVAAFDEAGCMDYVESMKQSLGEILACDELVEVWKKDYELYFYPVTEIYDSDVQELVAEISPWFMSYIGNIHRICARLYDWLHTEEGRPLLARLYGELDGCLDLEHCHHCELEALVSFHEIVRLPHGHRPVK